MPGGLVPVKGGRSLFRDIYGDRKIATTGFSIQVASDAVLQPVSLGYIEPVVHVVAVGLSGLKARVISHGMPFVEYNSKELMLILEA